MKVLENLVSFMKKHNKVILFICDVIAMGVACFLAAMLKFDAPNMFKEWFDDNILFIMLVDFISTMFFFILFKVYKRMWQYMVVNDYIKLTRAFVLSKVVTIIPFFYIFLSTCGKFVANGYKETPKT